MGNGGIQTLIVLIREALGKFQCDHTVGNVIAIFQFGIILLKIGLNGGYTGYIDRHGTYQLIAFDGIGNIAAYPLINVMVDLDDESVRLEDRQEGRGSTVELLDGIVPTDQRFTAIHTILDDIVFRLIEDNKFLVGKSTLCLGLYVRLLQVFLTHGLIIEFQRLIGSVLRASILGNDRLIHQYVNGHRTGLRNLVDSEIQLHGEIILFQIGIPTGGTM